MAQYLTLPLAITPRGADRPALIEQEIDELTLEDYKKDFINGQLLATRARPGRRVAGDAAEPFMVTIDGIEKAANSLMSAVLSETFLTATAAAAASILL